MATPIQALAPVPASKRELREEIREELLYLRDKGKLTPEDAVRRARRSSNPMHSEFEWDDTVAGHQHRLDQARHLFASYKITVQVTRVERREVTVVEVRQQEFIRSVAVPANIQLYESFEDVQADPKQMKLVMARELGVARTYLYKTLASAGKVGMAGDVWGLIKAVDGVLGKLE